MSQPNIAKKTTTTTLSQWVLVYSITVSLVTSQTHCILIFIHKQISFLFLPFLTYEISKGKKMLSEKEELKKKTFNVSNFMLLYF